MKMCLAPCFKGCTDEEYAAEVGRVQQFFETGGQSLVREIERQRDEASTGLDFEGAAGLHTRLERVKAAAAQLPEMVRRLDELNGVMVQPSAEPATVALFKIVAGRICSPVALNVGATGGPFGSQAAVDGVAHCRRARYGRGSRPSLRAGVDGASRAAQALVLPHHQNRGIVSRR